MVAMIKGNFVSIKEGVKKDGKPYCFTTLVSGTEAVQVFGYKAPPETKQFAPMDLLCEIQRSDRGLFCTYVGG